MSGRFCELHARSAFSFLRGSSRPEDLVGRAAELGLPAIALTDHQGVFGTARAHAAARAAGLRAIVGCTLEWQVDPPTGGAAPDHLPVLCTNRRGYSTLCRHLTGQALEPVARDVPSAPGLLLGEYFHPGDLIALTGDREGPLARRLLRGDRAGALRAARRLIDAFGKDNVCVEICRHHLRDDSRLNRELVELAGHLGLALVASNAPLHATRRGRMLADAFTCLRHHTTLVRAGLLLAPNSERHLKSGAEMAALFADHPEAVAHSARIAERCGFGLENLGYRFPDWPDETGRPLSTTEQTTLLRRRAYHGAARRYGALGPAVKRQIEHEIALIHRLGFPGYFLIVHDLVEFARGRGILCQGRGSAANSAVCYALGITHVDPVGGGLLFERFLSENRRSWPDIDIDFPSGPRREEVIQYVFRKYGPRGAAMTANVITYRPRSAFREMAKVLGLPDALADRFSRTRLPPWEENQGGRAATGPHAVLHALYQDVLGLPRHLGQHSGGMIIQDAGLDRIVPLQPAAMPGRTIIQWDKDDCEDLGIVKVDLLGLGMLAAMETTLSICAARGRPVDPARIPKDDPAVFEMLARADTIGTFQVESRAQMATLPIMKPKTFYDVAVEIAIIRPGPIVGDLLHPYLNRRNGREPVDFIHPSLEPVLKRTLGVPLFQEQVLRMAMILAGFSGAEADELRRAMGSSRSSERMERMTRLLRERMTAKRIAAEAQEKVIRSIGSFALYGFPESHAISFALIAYASCWLKVHRPAEFFAGLINHQPMGFYSVNTLIQDARRHGLRIRPVSCLHSMAETTVDDDHSLRLGLHRIKGLSAATAARIVAARQTRSFDSLPDLLERARPDQSERRLLAAAGAFNGLPAIGHRREALWQAELPLHDDLLNGGARTHRSGWKPELRNSQDGCFPSRGTGFQPVSEGGHPACPGGAPTHRSGWKPELRNSQDGCFPVSPLAPMTAAERLEADLLTQGASTGPHPMKLWRAAHGGTHRGLSNSRELAALHPGQPVRIAGLAICRQRPSTAKGHCFISLEDEFGIANLFVPKATFELHQALITTEAYLLAGGRLQISEGDQPTVFVTSLDALAEVPCPTAPASHDFR